MMNSIKTKAALEAAILKAAEAKMILDECIVSKVTHLVCGDLQKGSLYV